MDWVWIRAEGPSSPDRTTPREDLSTSLESHRPGNRHPSLFVSAVVVRVLTSGVGPTFRARAQPQQTLRAVVWGVRGGRRGRSNLGHVGAGQRLRR